MDKEKQIYCDSAWEAEFHKYGSSKSVAIEDFSPILLFGFTPKQILVFLGIRKVAKVKHSKLHKCTKIQVLCPYCQNISMQNDVTRNYRCPFCYKKSYISTSQGIFSLFMKKINSVEENTKVNLPTNTQQIEQR